MYQVIVSYKFAETIIERKENSLANRWTHKDLLISHHSLNCQPNHKLFLLNENLICIKECEKLIEMLINRGYGINYF